MWLAEAKAQTDQVTLQKGAGEPQLLPCWNGPPTRRITTARGKEPSSIGHRSRQWEEHALGNPERLMAVLCILWNS